MLTDPATTTIIGPGARRLTISGGGKSRVFDIRGGSVALSGVTITGGSADLGGGVRNQDGTLVLKDVAIRGNRALVGGGLFNEGRTTLSGVTFKNNRALIREQRLQHHQGDAPLASLADRSPGEKPGV